MGGSNSTRRVSFESDEDDNVTVVKGVRLSESVINRMREPSKPPSRSSPPSEARPKPAASPPSAPAVDESELRRKITEEVQKGLEEERSKTQYELHQWLEKERARVKAQARSDVQAHVQGEVSRILASERAAALDSAQKAVLSERLTAEEERLRTKLLAKQLEERDQQLRKQDAFYREQLNKLEERSTQFYKVINEDYHKAADEVNSKFRRYEISPVCADLQEQILKCYRENAGKTLLCSNIASLYMQCVNSAKQKKLRTGG
ncbi:coiled-coil-helix-coiled-coil-helix domain containing 3a isoform X3 [Tachysurus fulvidraco]|uniref:coiled-coil-helix-coiled-coil-helix domain containing 3a isoform X3 n=1 Tax=Tachysurus fulvidraco TaxID=1234273 RepID=UPI001FEFC183|nr:coiled-coil-helix-coiled-coil-helix domain containing 3a isoform X3 [Tachysurus fulvidraco]